MLKAFQQSQTQNFNLSQKDKIAQQQHRAIVQQINQFIKNITQNLTQSFQQNYTYDQSQTFPQIIVHEVKSQASQTQNVENSTQICYQQQFDVFPLQQGKTNQRQQDNRNEYKQDQQDNRNQYQIKIIQVQSLKSLQEAQNIHHILSTNIQHDQFPVQTIYTDNQHEKQQTNSETCQPAKNSQNKQEQLQKNSINQIQNNLLTKSLQNNQTKCKNKQKKTFFQTRYHQRVESRTYIKKDKTNDSKQNMKISEKFFTKNNQQSSISLKLKKVEAFSNQNKNSRSKLKSVNKKITSKVPPLIINHSKIRQTLVLEPQISLQGPVQKMKQILQDRNYNNFNQNQKQNSKPINRKIIKKSPYGLLQLIVRNQKNESCLAKIMNLRILKPGQLKKLNKKSRVLKLNKSGCDFLPQNQETDLNVIHTSKA